MKKATKTCNIKFGDNLFNTRKSKKVSQTQIAELCNVSRQSVSDWETGKSQPDFVNLVKIAQHFNVSTDFLLGLTDVSSTDKATKELCSTLGLSETAIDILRGDYFSFVKELVKGSEAEEIANSLKIDSIRLAIYLSEAINAMVDDYVDHIPETLSLDSEYEELSFLELFFRFFNHLSIPKYSTFNVHAIDTNAKEIELNAINSYIAFETVNNDGKSTLYETNIKSLLVDKTINDIVTKLNNTKREAFARQNNKKEGK